MVVARPCRQGVVVKTLGVVGRIVVFLQCFVDFIILYICYISLYLLYLFNNIL